MTTLAAKIKAIGGGYSAIDLSEGGGLIHETPLGVWDWFGDHGCFIGGAPMTEGYNEIGLTDPARTPFERLYIVHSRPAEDERAIIALRLRKRARQEKRIHDCMEIIPWDSADERDSLVIYELGNSDNPPEPFTSMPEETFLAEYAGRVTCWVK
jgi:hypothetical protein